MASLTISNVKKHFGPLHILKGIDLTGAKPVLLTAEMISGADRLITMGCGEACPVVPPSVGRDDWPLEDPKGQTIERVRAIREEIRARVEALVHEQGFQR